MKRLLFRIGLFTALLFLVTNCSSTKNKPTNVAFPKTDLDLDEEVYIPHLKSDRKNFFPETLAETVWVDSR